MIEKTQEQACAVPLIDRLRNVPEKAQYSLDVGKYETRYWPVGALCHEAADALSHLSDAQKGWNAGNAAPGDFSEDIAALATPPAADEAPAVPSQSFLREAVRTLLNKRAAWPDLVKMPEADAVRLQALLDLATPTDSAANAGAVPSDEAEGLLELVKDALYNAYGKGALGDFARSKNEQAKALGIAQAMDKLTIDTLATLRAALAPKADSSEPRAERVVEALMQCKKWAPLERHAMLDQAARDVEAVATPSPASEQVGEVSAQDLFRLASHWVDLRVKDIRNNEDSPEKRKAEDALFAACKTLSTAQPQADAGVSRLTDATEREFRHTLNRSIENGWISHEGAKEVRAAHGISPAPKEGD